MLQEFLISYEHTENCNWGYFNFKRFARKLITLQIPDSHFEKKNTQNEYLIAHFEYFFTCNYSKIVWLTENLNEIKITHYEKIFSHIKQKFSHFEKGLEINNIFVASLRLPLFSPTYITLKRNKKYFWKYLTNIKYIPHTPRKSSF